MRFASLAVGLLNEPPDGALPSSDDDTTNDDACSQAWPFFGCVPSTSVHQLGDVCECVLTPAGAGVARTPKKHLVPPLPGLTVCSLLD